MQGASRALIRSGDLTGMLQGRLRKLRPPIVEERSLKALSAAALLTAIAFAVRWVTGLVFSGITPFTTFYIAAAVATVLGGVEAGVLSALLGLLLVQVFIPSANEIGWIGAAFYAAASCVVIWLGQQYRTLVRELQLRESAAARDRDLVAEENRILSLIAGGAALPTALNQIAEAIEAFARNTLVASILLLDDDEMHLRHAAGPNLPADYIANIDGSEIGPSNGSCGTAAFTKKEVHVSDIEHDPLWDNYRHLAVPHGFKACWSTPLISRTGKVYGTFAQYFRECRAPSEHERQVVSMLAKTALMAFEEARTQAQRQLVLREMAHRVKNILAIVLSVASRTLRPHLLPPQFSEFEKRMTALACVQDVLTKTDVLSVDLRQLIEEIAVKPFLGQEGRLVVEGPPLQVVGGAVISLVLAFHELCTNAVKYGAFSNGVGKVLIQWSESGVDGDRFRLEWKETGGPRVKPPERQGFGSVMIERALASATGAAVKMNFDPQGLQCVFSIPKGVFAGSPLVPETEQHRGPDSAPVFDDR